MSEKSSIFAAGMRRYIVLILIGMAACVAYAQSAAEADRLFQAGEYAKAEVIYGKLKAKSPSNALYQYRHARCAYELGDMETAAESFRKAGSRYQLTHYYLGEACMKLWRFEEAEAAYQRYLHALSEPNERVAHVQAQLSKAALYQRYMKHVAQVCIVDSVEVEKDDFLKAYKLSAEAGKLSQDKNGYITFTSQRGDRRLTVVEREEMTMLAQSERLVDSWNEPTPLPRTVNSNTAQNYPFYLSDGVTLYFATQDSLGLGGWDICVSRFNIALNTWTKPENIGLPFNSEANDYMYVEDEKSGVGYFATDRFSDPQHVRVYTFLLPDRKQYLRDMLPDTLVRYARLEAYCTAAYPESRAQSVVHHPVRRVEEDVELTPLEKAEQQLENLRQQYADGDEELRQQLRPAILSLEHAVDSLYEQSKKKKE